jgi:hypothetical protein
MADRLVAVLPEVPAAEVTRIAAIGNPVIRNLEITECYSRLAASLASRGDRCSNPERRRLAIARREKRLRASPS